MINENDLALVIGMVLAVLSIPSLLNAWTEGRVPRFGALIALTGVVLIGIAAARNPGGYSIDEILPTFARVIRGLLN